MSAGKISAIAVLLLSFFIFSGSVQARYPGGSGTAENPYKINSAATLLELAGHPGDYGKYFILTADINLASYNFTTAVIAPDMNNTDESFYGYAFTGSFNGAGHKITNLTINTGGIGNDYLGLFGLVSSGEVKNLTLEDVNITGGDGSSYLGGLAGWNDSGNISNCISNGTVTGRDTSQCLGGLTGGNGGTIRNCHSAGTVAGRNSIYGIGGLVGINWWYGDVNNCYSTGTVTSEVNSSNIGGLVGLNYLGDTNNCYSTCTVTSGDNSTSLGGLVGRNDRGTIHNCYSAGDVTGDVNSPYLGGLVGFKYFGDVRYCYSTGDVTGGNDSNYLGGLVGGNSGTSLGHCYSTGTVTGGSGSTFLGGLVGGGSAVTKCYFLTGSGPANGYGTPLTDAQMKQQVNFVDWDFVNVWRIREGVGYPKLHISNYSGGSGTADDPYQIGTFNDLLAMAANTDDYDAYFILTADIDLVVAGPFTTAVIAPDTNNSNYTFEGTAFTGVFDGNGHTISNLNIDTNGAENDYLGLFGKVIGGEVKNLGLENVSITGGVRSYNLGGLTAWNDSNINNCYSTGAVTGGTNSSQNIGGLVGRSNGNISNCYSTGTVASGVRSAAIGGLVGDSNGNINSCYSRGGVSGEANSFNFGGFVGVNRGGTISNCYSTGNVTSGNDSDTFGGLTGYSSNCDISNCYSTGTVTGGNGSTHLGGLAGRIPSGTISSCYFLDTSGPANGYGTPLTDAQMKQQASFSGWDFVNVWRILEGVSYPILHMPNYSGGSGIANDPFQIANINDLFAMAADTNDYNKHFVLIANIDLDSYIFTTAVIAPDTNNTSNSFQGVTFKGVFNGNSHTISNLTIDTNGVGNDFLGLFGDVKSAQIKNLGLKNIRITGGDESGYIGGLVGYSEIGTTISNCYSTGDISGGDYSYYIGGLVGLNSIGSISNCHSTGNVTGGNYSQTLGGLVGYTAGNISNCYVTGETSGGDKSYCVGGLVGYNHYSTISNSYATGETSGGDNSYWLGGLVGWNHFGTINNCHSSGETSGRDKSYCVGGLAGENGDAGDGTINNCYSTGAVSGGDNSYLLGGLAGRNSGDINSCYFPVVEPNNNLGTPLKTTQMKQRASFVGWDFDDIWWINERTGYPKLYWQIDVTKCSVTAGSKPNKDKILFSGTMNTAAIDFNDANNIIKVTVCSDYLALPCEYNFPIDGNTFKKGKYKCSKTENKAKKSFTYDLKTRKFAFSASDVNLLGLDCPATAKIDISDCNRIAPLDETLVNGRTVPIPIKLMTGVENILRVDKCTVTQSTRANKDILSAKGAFTVENPDPCMTNWVTEDLVITLGSQQFTIPKINLKAGNKMFSCSNVKITNPNATATAMFNFNLCSFTVTIKDASIPDDISGDVNFGAAFADFDEVSEVTIP